jgi:hypothetical protein
MLPNREYVHVSRRDRPNASSRCIRPMYNKGFESIKNCRQTIKTLAVMHPSTRMQKFRSAIPGLSKQKFDHGQFTVKCRIIHW